MHCPKKLFPHWFLDCCQSSMHRLETLKINSQIIHTFHSHRDFTLSHFHLKKWSLPNHNCWTCLYNLYESWHHQDSNWQPELRLAFLETQGWLVWLKLIEIFPFKRESFSHLYCHWIQFYILSHHLIGSMGHPIRLSLSTNLDFKKN